MFGLFNNSGMPTSSGPLQQPGYGSSQFGQQIADRISQRLGGRVNGFGMFGQQAPVYGKQFNSFGVDGIMGNQFPTQIAQVQDRPSPFQRPQLNRPQLGDGPIMNPFMQGYGG